MEELPPELIMEILAIVNPKTIIKVCSIDNNRISGICTDDYFWKLKFRHDFPDQVLEGNHREQWMSTFNCRFICLLGILIKAIGGRYNFINLVWNDGAENLKNKLISEIRSGYINPNYQNVEKGIDLPICILGKLAVFKFKQFREIMEELYKAGARLDFVFPDGKSILMKVLLSVKISSCKSKLFIDFLIEKKAPLFYFWKHDPKNSCITSFGPIFEMSRHLGFQERILDRLYPPKMTLKDKINLLGLSNPILMKSFMKCAGSFSRTQLKDILRFLMESEPLSIWSDSHSKELLRKYLLMGEPSLGIDLLSLKIDPARLNTGRKTAKNKYYTVSELKEILRNLGLKVGGTKASLVQRIKQHLKL